MGGIRTTELLILLAVILILFGGSRIAGLGKALGSGIRNFKKGISGDDEETQVADAPEPSGKVETKA